eukprot:12895558-Prorocentrum_lima.AAC.1
MDTRPFGPAVISVRMGFDGLRELWCYFRGNQVLLSRGTFPPRRGFFATLLLCGFAAFPFLRLNLGAFSFRSE